MGSDVIPVLAPNLESVLLLISSVVLIDFLLPDLEHKVFLGLHAGFKVEEADGGHGDEG